MPVQGSCKELRLPTTSWIFTRSSSDNSRDSWLIQFQTYNRELYAGIYCRQPHWGWGTTAVEGFVHVFPTWNSLPMDQHLCFGSAPEQIQLSTPQPHQNNNQTTWSAHHRHLKGSHKFWPVQIVHTKPKSYLRPCASGQQQPRTLQTASSTSIN